MAATDWYGDDHLNWKMVRNWTRIFVSGVLRITGHNLDHPDTRRLLEYVAGREVRHHRVMRHCRTLEEHVVRIVKYCRAAHPRCADPEKDHDILRTFLWSDIKAYIAGEFPEAPDDPEQSVPHPECNAKLDLLVRLCVAAYHMRSEYDVALAQGLVGYAY